MADLEDGDFQWFKETRTLTEIATILKFDLVLAIKSEKTVSFECTLDHTHYFTNGKVLSHNIC